jgi:dihydroorotase-like cyclic amidohydrolase
MELPFGGTFASDDFETGTVAAAYGGTTTIIDFAVQGMGEPLQKAYEAWRVKAEGKVAIDYALHMIVRDMPEVQLGEFMRRDESRRAVTSFKLVHGLSPAVFSGTTMRPALARLKAAPGTTAASSACHAEKRRA